MLGYDIRRFSIFLISLITFLLVYFSFGKPLIFDRFVIGVFLLTALISFKLDKNIFSIACIFLIERTVEEIAWLFYDKQLAFQYLMMILVAVTCFLTRKSTLSQFSFGMLILVIFANFYWYIIDYQRVIKFGWSFFTIFQSLITYHVIRHRVFIFRFIFIGEKEIKDTPLDKYLQLVIFGYTFLVSLWIMEYLARHVLGQTDLLLIYNMYSYLSHFLTGILLWIIFNEVWLMLKKSHIFA